MIIAEFTKMLCCKITLEKQVTQTPASRCKLSSTTAGIKMTDFASGAGTRVLLRGCR